MEYKHSKVWLVVVLLLWLLLLDGFFPHKWTTLSTVGQVVCPNTLECQLIASSQKLEWSKLVSILQVMWIPFSIKHTNVHPIMLGSLGQPIPYKVVVMRGSTNLIGE